MRRGKLVSSILEFKTDILRRLLNSYPNEMQFTEIEYGCYIFESPDLYLNPDNDKTLEIIRRSKNMTKAFSELKLRGIIHPQRVSHMGWTARLTAFGHHLLINFNEEYKLTEDDIIADFIVHQDSHHSIKLSGNASPV